MSLPLLPLYCQPGCGETSQWKEVLCSHSQWVHTTDHTFAQGSVGVTC